MADNLVNGDSENSGQTLITVNSTMLETAFDASTTDMESEEIEKAKRKSHHNEVEKRRKYKLNDGINKLVEVLPCRDSKRSKTQILEDTFNLVRELQEKCDRLMIQNAPESEVDEIKRLMEENAKLKKENEEFMAFLRTMNITTDLKTHIKAMTQNKSRKNPKQDPPSDQLFGTGQNIIIQSPTAAVMGSPNLVTMPTNQMTIPVAGGNRIASDAAGSIIQASSQPGGGMLLVAGGKATGNTQQTTAATAMNQTVVASSASNEQPEAEGQGSGARMLDQNQTLDIPVDQQVDGQAKQMLATNEGTTTSISNSLAMTCTHEASNQNSAGQVATTTAESTNVTAVTQVISTPITTPVSQNTVLLPSGTSGVRLVQQQPVQQPQGQTVLIQLPGQPGQYVPVRIAPQVNQPQQVILTSQQGVNVIGTRGNAIQPKTPVKKKQPQQLKVKNIFPLQPNTSKPNSPGTSQGNVQPIAPNNTVTVRLPMGQTANQQQSTFVVNNQGQLVLQQQPNPVMQLPVQVVQKPQVTQNVVYIQQNGQLIPVILQQNSGVQQTVPTGTIIQGQQQQQPIRVQVSQSVGNRPIQSNAAVAGGDNQLSATSIAASDSGEISASSQSITTQSMSSELQTAESTVSAPASQMPSNSLHAGGGMTPLAIETSTSTCAVENGVTSSQNNNDFAANDILAKATESIFANMSETSPLHDLHSGSAGDALVNDTVMKNTGLFGNQPETHGIEIYDLPDDMDDSSTSKSKHKKKKKKKAKAKEKEKKKKDKDKDKDRSKKKAAVQISETTSSDNLDRDNSEVSQMANELLSLMEGMESSGNAQTLKNHVSESMSTEMPASSNGNAQLSSNFSAESLLTTVSSSLNNQRDGAHPVSTSATSSAEASGQALFGSLNSLTFGSDILSSSMSVSGLPTYIDDEGEMAPTGVPMDGQSGNSSTSKEGVTTTINTTAVTSTVSQSALSLSLPAQTPNQNVPSEQKTMSDPKVDTTPTSDSFQSFLSPSSFPSISSLLEQSSNPNQQDAPTSSLPESSQKDSSPVNGFSSGPAQHGWISNHSKASELARGIQPAKSQSPCSTVSPVTTGNITFTTASGSITTPAIMRNQSNTASSTDNATSVSSSKPSQNSYNALQQPWLGQSSSEALFETSNASMRQQQQLVDMLQGIPGLTDPKGPPSSSSNDSISGTSDALNQLATPPKGTTPLDSIFGLPLTDTKSSTPLSSNGDMFQGIASIVESGKDKNSRDGFLGLPSYSESTSTSAVSKGQHPSPSRANQSLFSIGAELEEPKESVEAGQHISPGAVPNYSFSSNSSSDMNPFKLNSGLDQQKTSTSKQSQYSTSAPTYSSSPSTYSFSSSSTADQNVFSSKSSDSSNSNVSAAPSYLLSAAGKSSLSSHMPRSGLDQHNSSSGNLSQNISPLPSYSMPSRTSESSFMDNSHSSAPRQTSSVSNQHVSTAPSYSLANRMSALAGRNKERNTSHQERTASDRSDKRSSSSQQNPTSTQERSIQQNTSSSQQFQMTHEINRQSESRTETSMASRYVHPKNRALASASASAQESRIQSQTSHVSSPTPHSSGPGQQRQRNADPGMHRKSQMPVKNFSPTTIHRTLTAGISEDADDSKEQEVSKPPHPPPRQEHTQPIESLRAPDAQQLPLPQSQGTEVIQAPSKPSKRKRPKKPLAEPKDPVIVIEDKEDLDNVGRRELPKNLVNQFPWLAESDEKKKEQKNRGKQTESNAQATSAGPSTFSIQSISQSSSKKPSSKSGNVSGSTSGEAPQNPPPYHARVASSQADAHSQLWNPSSFDVSASSSTVSSRQVSREKSQKHLQQIATTGNQQSMTARPDPPSQSRPVISSSNRPVSGSNNRPQSYEPSSSDSVKAAVEAAVNKARMAHQNTSAANVVNVNKERTAPKNKKAQHADVISSTHMMRQQTEIDDSLDFLTSTSTNSSTYPSSMATSVSMDIFGSPTVTTSEISKQPEQPCQTSSRRSLAQDKTSRVESSTTSYLMSPDYDTSLNSGIAQDNFSFSSWNLEPTQSEARDIGKSNNPHKIQELASPPIQQVQRPGNNANINISFGDTPNLGTGDDLDFPSLTSFQTTSQPQRTPSDRQTPQNQTYSVPSGRSSVASMEPSPLQASPMNYNVHESGRLSQMSDMPHSNSSSRGPPSVEAPQQQRRVTHSPMMQSSHGGGQGIKRPANDNHLMTAAKKASGGVHSGRRSGQQQPPESRQHSAIRTNQQSSAQGNALSFHTSGRLVQNQNVADNSCLGSEPHTSLFPQGVSRSQESARSKKRAQNPTDGIFSRETHSSDGNRSMSQDPWANFSGSQRTPASSAESSHSTFLSNFSNSQPVHSQAEVTPSSSSAASIIPNISPSRRLQRNEMPTYLPSHLPNPILPSPPQSKSNLSRETADITPTFNTMFTSGRTGTLHGVGMSNFPVFHEHQPPGGFNITKANQLPGAVPSFNYSLFNDSSPMSTAAAAHAASTDAPPPLNHGIGLPSAVHLHGNSTLPVEDSVLHHHGNVGPRHPGQHFSNNVMRVESILGQNRTPDVRPPFKMGVGVPPMGMPQHFHGSTFGHPY